MKDSSTCGICGEQHEKVCVECYLIDQEETNKRIEGLQKQLAAVQAEVDVLLKLNGLKQPITAT